ncbi:hypothetical protein BDW62DRAFT_175107, partial [Aspergillus aurantiobrunneus]
MRWHCLISWSAERLQNREGESLCGWAVWWVWGSSPYWSQHWFFVQTAVILIHFKAQLRALNTASRPSHAFLPSFPIRTSLRSL